MTHRGKLRRCSGRGEPLAAASLCDGWCLARWEPGAGAACPCGCMQKASDTALKHFSTSTKNGMRRLWGGTIQGFPWLLKIPAIQDLKGGMGFSNWIPWRGIYFKKIIIRDRKNPKTYHQIFAIVKRQKAPSTPRWVQFEEWSSHFTHSLMLLLHSFSVHAPSCARESLQLHATAPLTCG